MAARRATFNLSPQILHEHMMATQRPAMTFRPSVDGKSRAALKNWQRRLRAKLKVLIGWGSFAHGADRGSLRVRSLWRRKHELGTIEKIIFTAEPKADVPAYVCLPASAERPYEWSICVQGHSTGMHNSINVDFATNRKPIRAPGDRDFGLHCMRRGIAALCIEQRGFGERKLAYPSGCENWGDKEAAFHALQLGRTMIAERVFDVDRGLDYLATRDDVGAGRIGIMGNSGGGTISTFSAAVLPRLSFCMPSCYFCTFADSIMAMPHCACNYVPGLLQTAEMADVLGIFAPKPVVVVAGKTDPIFPLAATRREFARLKAIYAAAGAADRCKLVVGGNGHRFYARLGWAAMQRLMSVGR